MLSLRYLIAFLASFALAFSAQSTAGLAATQDAAPSVSAACPTGMARITVLDGIHDSAPGATQTVRFTIAAGCEDVQVSLVSYSTTGPVYDRATAHLQTVFDQEGGVFDAGTHTLSIDVPSCYYQVDLVFGAVIPQLGGPNGTNNSLFYGAQGRLITAISGGTKACGSEVVVDVTPVITTTPPVVLGVLTPPATGETAVQIPATTRTESICLANMILTRTYVNDGLASVMATGQQCGVVAAAASGTGSVVPSSTAASPLPAQTAVVGVQRIAQLPSSSTAPVGGFSAGGLGAIAAGVVLLWRRRNPAQ